MISTKNCRLIVIGLAAVLGIAWVIYFGDNLERQLLPYQEEVKQMNQLNDSLRREIQHLDQLLLTSRYEADSLQKLLNEDEEAMRNLKASKNEKIQLIDNYDGHELFEFFSKLNTHHPEIR